MNALASLPNRRAKAREWFRMAGIPNRRLENWKYTDVRAVLDEDTVERAGDAHFSLSAPGAEASDLSVSVPDWVNQYIGRSQVGVAMQFASFGFAKGGFAARVPKGESVTAQLAILSAGQTRGVIRLEENASLVLVERVDVPSSFQNVGYEFWLGPGSLLRHVRIVPKSETVQVAEIAINLERAAHYSGHFSNFGGKLSRTELQILLMGENAQAHLSGVSLVDEGLHADITTHIEHRVPNTTSTQLFKLIAGGKSRGVYQGKVSVGEGANGTDSRQTAKGLLLGERAEIDLKPELEILADDVKCAHGAAVGDLDAESLFYLRSRGVPEVEARALLMRAFLEDAVAEIADETIRGDVWSRVEAALAELSA